MNVVLETCRVHKTGYLGCFDLVLHIYDSLYDIQVRTVGVVKFQNCQTNKKTCPLHLKHILIYTIGVLDNRYFCFQIAILLFLKSLQKWCVGQNHSDPCTPAPTPCIYIAN